MTAHPGGVDEPASPLGRKPLTAEQDAGNLASNGGLILLRESALRSQVAAVVADAVPDHAVILAGAKRQLRLAAGQLRTRSASYRDQFVRMY